MFFAGKLRKISPDIQSRSAQEPFVVARNLRGRLDRRSIQPKRDPFTASPQNKNRSCRSEGLRPYFPNEEPQSDCQKRPPVEISVNRSSTFSQLGFGGRFPLKQPLTRNQT